MGREEDEDYDPYLDDLTQFTVFQAFDHYLGWNGIEGYTEDFIDALDAIRGAEFASAYEAMSRSVKRDIILAQRQNIFLILAQTSMASRGTRLRGDHGVLLAEMAIFPPKDLPVTVENLWKWVDEWLDYNQADDTPTMVVGTELEAPKWFKEEWLPRDW
jgi:hypothetical protein